MPVICEDLAVETIPKVHGTTVVNRVNGQRVYEGEGSNFLRQRIILSVISGRIISVRNIRHLDEEPGLKDYEVKFLRLIERITNGSSVFINKTGTRFELRPGSLRGGVFDFDCGLQRGIGYFLEGILLLAPFCKQIVSVNFSGLTWCRADPSVDLIKYNSLPLLQKFLGTDEGLELKIRRRGMPPEGGGLVNFSCPTRSKLRPIQMTDPGKVKRIRGTVWACRVAPNTVNRIIESSRSVLNNFVSDIYLYSDHCSGDQAGKSPGFGISLLAETVNGCKYAAELASSPRGETAVLAEDIGKQCAELLIQEIWKGGCVDSFQQVLAIGLMAIGSADVSKVLTGPITNASAQFLRSVFEFLSVRFHIDDYHRVKRAAKSAKRRKLEEQGNNAEESENDEESDDDESYEETKCRKYMLTCVGCGLTNINKVSF